MKSNNVIQEKSYRFAIRVVLLCKKIQNEKREYVLSQQLLKSGTSIGANIEEAIGAQSKKDFFTKLSIAYKEARETHYWIRLLSDTDYIIREEKESYLREAEELLRIIGSIQKTIKKDF